MSLLKNSIVVCLTISNYIKQYFSMFFGNYDILELDTVSEQLTLNYYPFESHKIHR